MTYKGEWLNNKKHGYGTATYPNGNIYEGEWKDNKREGHGVVWVRDSDVNSKSISAALLAKSSLTTGTTRRVYAGEWSFDKKNGKGIYYYPSGARYEGNWKDNIREGEGSYYHLNGDIYRGGYVSGVEHGLGCLTKSTGDVYEGQYINGKREGQGIYYYKSRNQVYDGEWVNDQPTCGIILNAQEFFAQQQPVNEQKEQTESERSNLIQTSTNSLEEDSTSTSSKTSTTDIYSTVRPLLTPAVRTKSVRALLSSSSTTSSQTEPIPRLQLADPDTVLLNQLETISIIRNPLRSLTPTTSLSSLYDISKLDLLKSEWIGISNVEDSTKQIINNEDDKDVNEINDKDYIAGYINYSDLYYQIEAIWSKLSLGVEKGGKLTKNEFMEIKNDLSIGIDFTNKNQLELNDIKISFIQFAKLLWLLEQSRMSHVIRVDREKVQQDKEDRKIYELKQAFIETEKENEEM